MNCRFLHNFLKIAESLTLSFKENFVIYIAQFFDNGESWIILILRNLFNIPYEELLKCFDSGAALAAERLKDPTADKRQKDELSEKHKRIMLDKTAIYELPKEEQQLVLY